MGSSGVRSEIGLLGYIFEVLPGIQGSLVDLTVLLVYPYRECCDGLWVRSGLDLDG